MECSEEVLHAKILSKIFQQLCCNFEQPSSSSALRTHRRVAETNMKIVNFLANLQRLIQADKCHKETFKAEVVKEKSVQLEILWYLQIANILNVSEYLSYHQHQSNREVTEEFNAAVLKACLQQTGSLRRHLCGDFLSVILENKNGSKYCTYNHFINLLTSFVKSRNSDVVYFLKTFELTSLTETNVKSFFYNLLKMLLIGPHYDVKVALQKQQLNQLGEPHDQYSQITSHIFKIFDSNEMILLLEELISNNPHTINWDFTLCFMNSFINVYSGESINPVKSLIAHSLEKAFTNLNADYLSIAFVIVRHCCHNESGFFPSYLQWFSSTFSSESVRPINSKQTCLFFINFLTDIAGLDLPYYLKIHINRAPHVPIDCQPLLSDYIKLVKTRLCDLNESFELGFFENCTGKSSPENDVENVLKSFVATKEIPRCVLEGSIFCKQYYEKKFLPKLLSQFDGRQSIRHIVIMKLHSLGKLSPSLFLNYKLLMP